MKKEKYSEQFVKNLLLVMPDWHSKLVRPFKETLHREMSLETYYCLETVRKCETVTMTELAQQLQSGGFMPNWIVRRLNAKHDILLQKYGIRYRTRRSKEGKTLLLRWVGVR